MADQGTVYGNFIDGELTAEHARKTALEARGSAILTTSSAFATFILAVAAIVRANNYQYNADSLPYILVVISLFVLAGIAGLLANMLHQYQVATIEAMRRMLSTQWMDSETSARNATGWLRLRTLQSLRKGNNTKAFIIVIGHVLQVGAVVALAITVVREIT